MNNTQVGGKAYSWVLDDEKMYSDLEMDDERIRHFMMAPADFPKKKAKMSNGEMLGSTQSERTWQLEGALSPEQFTKYKDWQAETDNLEVAGILSNSISKILIQTASYAELDHFFGR